MKTISLSQGRFALVDDQDFDIVSKFKWSLQMSRNKKRSYAVRMEGDKRVYLHRFLMKAPKGSQVDHLNGDGLDDRRQNLRIVNNSYNHLSFMDRAFRGASKIGSRWKSRVMVSGKQISLGCFDSAEEAAQTASEYRTKIINGEI